MLLAEKLRLKQLKYLKPLFSHLQTMGWTLESDFRGRAKVPIIFLTHACGVSCDISLGITAKNTRAVVDSLSEKSGRDRFFVLVSFLKVFLSLIGLDKPYTGGLGSYKIYVMVALIISKHMANRGEVQANEARLRADARTTVEDGSKGGADANELEELLLSFFSYFSLEANLNQQTVLTVWGAECSFETAFLIDQCQQAFKRALVFLSKTTSQFSSKSGAGGALRKLDNATAYLALSGNPSSSNSICHLEQQKHQRTPQSRLNTIVNSMRLQVGRSAALMRSAEYPSRSEAQKNAVASTILAVLQKRILADVPGINEPVFTLEDIKKVSPLLAAR